MRPLADLIAALGAVFEAEATELPGMTLRSGDSVDVYGPDYPFDPSLDAISDDYLSRFADGLNYLDATSWKHYLPAFGAFALAHKNEGSNVVGALIASLRPPDREPPRLSSLSPAQEELIREVLEVLAFAEDSVWQEDACRALQEWWVENPLYRHSR